MSKNQNEDAAKAAAGTGVNDDGANGTIQDQNQDGAQMPKAVTEADIVNSPIFAEMIAKSVASALAQQSQAQAEKSAAEATEKAKEEAAAVKPSTWPYGNMDTKKEFDLSKLTRYKTLPTDEVILLYPLYAKDGLGNPTEIDYKNSKVDYRAPADHYQDSQIISKDEGKSTYDLLGLKPIVLHDPTQA